MSCHTLDPAKVHLIRQLEAFQVTKCIIDNKGVPSYCKTVGSMGLHTYNPLGNN